MKLHARVQPVRIDPAVLSYYKDGRGGRIPLCKTAGGMLTPDAAQALLQLHQIVARDGGTLLVTDAYRDVSIQTAARRKYENWLAAGKPKAGTGGFDPKTMKAAFVARPGRSFHSGARAVDLAHLLAAPASVPKTLKLDWLWERAQPLGFQPILKAPEEGASEAWHFDFRGPWSHVYEHLGYEQTAMAATLDIGQGAELFARPWERWVQAQMWRAGVDCGDIDGYFGARSYRAADLLGLNLQADAAPLQLALAALPGQNRVLHAA